jgi:glucose-6-phosphate isomerase
MLLLFQLAEASGVEAMRDAMFAGEKINTTEHRAVLHTALRNQAHEHITVDGEDVLKDVHHAILNRMAAFADKVRSGDWKGYTGKPIKTIVNIGIGGSDLGPVMVTEALKHYSKRDLEIRFVSNIDSNHIVEQTRDLDPAETLFIIAIQDVHHRRDHDQRPQRPQGCPARLKDEAAIAKHFVAISTNAEEVAKFGIDTDNMFGFWDWVGGRYSLTSAIGLSIMMSIGPKHFHELLKGFYTMDEHFRTAPLGTEPARHPGTGRIVVYELSTAQPPKPSCHTTNTCTVSRLTPAGQYGEQRKIRHQGGEPVDYTTGPVIWGEPGTNGQHAFYQLLTPGNTVHSLRFHRIRRTAQPARQTPPETDGQLHSPDAGTGLRQVPPTKSGRKASRRRLSSTRYSRATGQRTHCSCPSSRRMRSAS